MLAFFRKYQRYFYLVMTTVIVISFSFFGTYGAMTEQTHRDEKVFTAVDGSSVNRSDVEKMALFIGTDSKDMQHFGSWGPNFFNDGVIDKDFVETGLAKLLVLQYADQLKGDIEAKAAREKHYRPYEHPAFKALSATEVWRKYNPQKMEFFTALQTSRAPLSDEGVTARLNLYQAEREFGGQELKQAIQFAEKMNQNWVRPDPALAQSDLSLFGYHTVDDWFGPKFTRIVSAFIINAAKEAELKGYTVPNDEVLADLIRNARTSYSKVAGSGRLGVANANDYFREQLRRMHMDENQAIHTWKQVMLFRRLFGDVGGAVVTDTLTAKQFLDFAKESVSGDEYSLPESLQIGNFKDFQKFQAYLNALAPKSDDPLTLPTTFKPLSEVPASLLEQRYLVEVAQVERSQVATSVGVRATWDWEFDAANWSTIVEAFPELGVADPKTAEQREKVLDRLDINTRARVDSFAREQILKKDPNWADDALAKAPVETKLLSIREEGGSDPLPGVTDRKAFITFLEGLDEEKGLYSPDRKTFYAVKIVDKDSTPHIMTYAQAKKEGVLDALSLKELNDYYVRIREGNPKEFQLIDGDWKELQYVRTDVAKRLHAKALDKIQNQAKKLQPSDQQPKEWTADLTAALRFIKHVNDGRTALAKGSNDSNWIAEPALAEDGLMPVPPLEDQWKLNKKTFKGDRSQGESSLGATPNTWSTLQTAPNGQISFRYIAEAGADTAEPLLIHDTYEAHNLLSNGAKQFYMKRFLAKLDDKGAMALDYLQPVKE